MRLLKDGVPQQIEMVSRCSQEICSKLYLRGIRHTAQLFAIHGITLLRFSLQLRICRVYLLKTCLSVMVQISFLVVFLGFLGPVFSQISYLPSTSSFIVMT